MNSQEVIDILTSNKEGQEIGIDGSINIIEQNYNKDTSNRNARIMFF